MRSPAWTVWSLVLLLGPVATAGSRAPAPQTPAGAQTATAADLPRGTGLILGQVVDTSGRGVSGVVVSLGGAITQVGGYTFTAAPLPGGPRRTLTTSEGRFVFPDLPAGRYSLDATKTGYLPGAFGRRRPSANAQTLSLGDGERNGTVKIIVFEFGAISGTVTDESGEPVVGVTVRALRRVHESGRARYTASASATTDDRGGYRLSALPMGDYLVTLPSTMGTTPVSLYEAYLQALQNGTSADMQRELGLMNVSTMGLMSGGLQVGNFILQNGSFSGRTAIGPPPDAAGRLSIYPTTFYRSTAALSRAEILTI